MKQPNNTVNMTCANLCMKMGCFVAIWTNRFAPLLAPDE